MKSRGICFVVCLGVSSTLFGMDSGDHSSPNTNSSSSNASEVLSLVEKNSASVRTDEWILKIYNTNEKLVDSLVSSQAKLIAILDKFSTAPNDLSRNSNGVRSNLPSSAAADDVDRSVVVSPQIESPRDTHQISGHDRSMWSKYIPGKKFFGCMVTTAVALGAYRLWYSRSIPNVSSWFSSFTFRNKNIIDNKSRN